MSGHSLRTEALGVPVAPDSHYVQSSNSTRGAQFLISIPLHSTKHVRLVTPSSDRPRTRKHTAAMTTMPVPYTAPPTRLSRAIIICGIVMALTASKRLAYPGSIVHSQLMTISPTAAKTAMWLQTGIFWLFYGAHTIESAIFAKKLRDHGVGILSTAWWKWMAECFIGGKFCFEHFDGVVKGKAA